MIIDKLSAKPTLTTRQIATLSFGFFGIQFGWNLQLANMSAIYSYLGANPDQIPILWLAAPLTGLLVQPVIGHLSDRTWNRFGRRRPYFLSGAILSAIALFLMPSSTSLLTAALLLWVLDASINISMEPFRAFVADMLPKAQHASGYAMQSMFIGLGAIAASALPWFLGHFLQPETSAHLIPEAIRISFRAGAVVFLGAVLWTVTRTKEYPPTEPPEPFEWRQITHAFATMPLVMKRLALVQVATWLGLFWMWLYFTVTVATKIFGGTDPQSPAYTRGVEWANLCFGMYSLVCFLFSLALPAVSRKIGRRNTHTVCLIAGALGLLSVGVVSDYRLLLLSMTGVGIAWASILSIPYAMLAGSLPPNRTGFYMGVFNFFIVIPEICASLGFGWVMRNVLSNNTLTAVVAGGVCLLIAAALMRLVPEEAA